MADPHHVPDLDAFDRVTVVSYRLGLVLAAAGVVGLAGTEGLRASGILPAPRLEPVRLVLVGVLVAAWNLHLYARVFRWIFRGLPVAAAILVVVGGLGGLVGLAALGFGFASLSAFALKERFCFRIPGLGLVPWLLAGALVPLLLDVPGVSAALLAPAGVLVGVLAVAKLRMPLHFDVGDRSKYEV